jgi:hypothetical protein
MTPLMYAVKDNRAALLDRMVELGADVCARNNVSTHALCTLRYALLAQEHKQFFRELTAYRRVHAHQRQLVLRN